MEKQQSGSPREFTSEVLAIRIGSIHDNWQVMVR